MALLPGKTIEGCCGDLENEQIVFSYKIHGSKDAGTFSVGKICAGEFLKLINETLPDLINPMMNISVPGATPTNGGGATRLPGPAGSGQPQAQMPALNEELYRAITIWCIVKNMVPKFQLQTILERIQTNPYESVTEKEVFEFLKTLSAYRKTLKQELQDAQAKYPGFKNFTFPELTAIAHKNWIDLP